MDNAPKKSWQTPLYLFFKISAWIAFPVIIALFLGKWFDRMWGTDPVFFLLLTAIAFVVSLVAIVREAKKTFADIEKSAIENSQKQ